jgi:outer membrane autotransporter protein
MTGNTFIENGVLELTEANGVGTGDVTVATAADDKAQGLNLNLVTAQAFNNTLNGDGVTTVAESSALATITGHNAATYTGNWEIAGNAAVDPAQTNSQHNLGTGTVNIASTGTLAANTLSSNGANGDFTFNNQLTGTGTLAANNDGGAFDFGSTAEVGTAFAGTVALSNNTFQLDNDGTHDNAAALANATLKLGTDNLTTVGNGPQSIGGLTFDGGTMVFDASAPAQSKANNLVTVTDLDVSGTGAVRINVPNPYDVLMPTVAPDLSLFAQSHFSDGLQLVSATGSVTGAAADIAVQDQTGTEVSAQKNINIEQDGALVAIGTYDYKLDTTGVNGDGLYVGYGLKVLDLQEGQTLALTEAPGAVGNDADLAAQLIGKGNLEIAANDTVSLSHPGNTFTGSATISSGTLQAKAADVIATASSVTVQNGANFDIHGFDQSVNDLTGEGTVTNSTATDATLALHNSSTSTFDGSLTGAQLAVEIASGTTRLTGNNTYGGDTSINDGATLQAGAVNTLSANSQVNVASNGTLDLANYSQTVAAMNNAGNVNFGAVAEFDPSKPTVLTVMGDYEGNGGTLQMRTQLGNDRSPTDQLVIGGDAKGKTNIALSNAGGLGAWTNGNGIELVSVGGTSASEAFALNVDGNEYIDAGAYRYRLFNGPVSGTDANWYLRSQASDGTEPGPGPDSGNGSGPNPTPEYRPEVPWLTALPGLLRQGNLDLIDNLHRRMGDDLSGMQNDDRLWARVFGGDAIRQRQDNVTSPQGEGSNWGFQAGVDLFQSRDGEGKRHDVGFYGAHLEARSNITGMTGASEEPTWMGILRPETTAAGAYWTYKASAGLGFYTDLIAQYNWYSGNGQAVTGAQAKIKGNGVLGSLELGYGTQMSQHWTIQPQAQLVAQKSRIDSIGIANATVKFEDKLSLAGRLGIRMVGDYTTGGHQWKPYVRTNLWHGFDGKQNTVIQNPAATTPIATQMGYDALEAGAGFTVALNRNVSLYGEADHVFAVGKASSQLSKGVTGSLGIRVMFGGDSAPAPMQAKPLPMPVAEAPAVEAPAPVVTPVAPPVPAAVEPVRITLSADMLFDFDSAQLRAAGRDSLEGLARELRGMDYEVVIVNGHTDRIGSEAYNQGLSERRANAVRKFLIDGGMPANGVRAVGYGKSQPVTTLQQCEGQRGATLVSCLQPDRRVEVEVRGALTK